jgi:hypothetical protein
MIGAKMKIKTVNNRGLTPQQCKTIAEFLNKKYGDLFLITEKKIKLNECFMLPNGLTVGDALELKLLPKILMSKDYVINKSGLVVLFKELNLITCSDNETITI